MNKESISVRFLYSTTLGRLLLKPLVNRNFSKFSGSILSSPISKPLIKYYIKKYNIDMSQYEKCNYASFNDFFIRKKKVIDYDKVTSSFVSPCDGFLSVYKIDDNAFFRIKHSVYSTKDLLDSEMLADEFKGGHCLIFRLTPRHFHRYIFIDNGETVSEKSIPGILHCVRPVACDRYPVYVQNQRTYTQLKTENFGTLIQMEIGAIIVGKINNHQNITRISRGMEKGYFEFGGSTIIILTKKDAVEIDDKILCNSKNNIETEVTAGQKLGVSTKFKKP